uniref:Uncharacterized protein n=1 Tax=viral metagenome TaxID=1070528 RepID=A0A6C0ASL8_9ZZZZ
MSSTPHRPVTRSMTRGDNQCHADVERLVHANTALTRSHATLARAQNVLTHTVHLALHESRRTNDTTNAVLTHLHHTVHDTQRAVEELTRSVHGLRSAVQRDANRRAAPAPAASTPLSPRLTLVVKDTARRNGNGAAACSRAPQ